MHTLFWKSHFHFVASAPQLPIVLQGLKSWTARKVIDLLTDRKSETLVRQLRAMKLTHKKEGEYQVWQEGSKPKQIQNDEMMWQKTEYIHNNPVARGFVDNP